MMVPRVSISLCHFSRPNCLGFDHPKIKRFGESITLCQVIEKPFLGGENDATNRSTVHAAEDDVSAKLGVRNWWVFGDQASSRPNPSIQVLSTTELGPRTELYEMDGMSSEFYLFMG